MLSLKLSNYKIFTFMAQNYTSNPSHYFKAYKSNTDRAPKKKLIKIKNDINKRQLLSKLYKNFTINNNLLCFNKNKKPVGQKIVIKGNVTDTSGVPLKNIIIEIWQANASGKYRDKNDKHDATIDPNFYGYGVTKTNNIGNYKFISILPGAYPWNNHKNAWRPRHIHFSILDLNFFSRLCTQMYFPGDFLLNDDPIYNSIPKEHRNKVIAKYDNKKNKISNYLTFNFDIIL